MALKDYSDNEAVRSRGTGPGIHITPLLFTRANVRVLKEVSTWDDRILEIP